MHSRIQHLRPFDCDLHFFQTIVCKSSLICLLSELTVTLPNPFPVFVYWCFRFAVLLIMFCFCLTAFVYWSFLILTLRFLFSHLFCLVDYVFIVLITCLFAFCVSFVIFSFRALSRLAGFIHQDPGLSSPSGRTTSTPSSCPVGIRLTATLTRTASSNAGNTLTIIRTHTHASLVTTALTQVTRPLTTKNGGRIAFMISVF